MSTAGLHAALTAEGMSQADQPAVFALADTLTRASRLGHILQAEHHTENQPTGHEFRCSRCRGLIAWMPGVRALHRGTAAMAPCVAIIRALVAEDAATADQREWLAQQEQNTITENRSA
jgi:hypothetical protein